jgi:hypothetical protein
MMKLKTTAEFLKRLAKTKKRKWLIKPDGRIRCEAGECPGMAALGGSGAGIELAAEDGLISWRLTRQIIFAADVVDYVNPLRRRILGTLGLKECE